MITPKLYAWKGTKWIRRDRVPRRRPTRLLGSARLLEHRRTLARRPLRLSPCSSPATCARCSPTSPDASPSLVDPRAVYEPKYDGIRAIVLVEPGPPPLVRLWSRNGNEKSAQFPELVAALVGLGRGARRAGGARRRDRGPRRPRPRRRLPAPAGPHQRLGARLPVVGPVADARGTAGRLHRLRPAARRRHRPRVAPAHRAPGRARSALPPTWARRCSGCSEQAIGDGRAPLRPSRPRRLGRPGREAGGGPLPRRQAQPRVAEAEDPVAGRVRRRRLDRTARGPPPLRRPHPRHRPGPTARSPTWAMSARASPTPSSSAWRRSWPRWPPTPVPSTRRRRPPARRIG